MTQQPDFQTIADESSETVRVICTGIDLEPATQNKNVAYSCVFGMTKVPCTVNADRGVECICPPPRPCRGRYAQEKEVTLRVIAEGCGDTLAEAKFDYTALPFWRKPSLEGRFSGRLPSKEDERRLVEECKLLAPLLGGIGKHGDATLMTLAKLVRGVASGEVRRHCEQRERNIKVLQQRVAQLEQAAGPGASEALSGQQEVVQQLQAQLDAKDCEIREIRARLAEKEQQLSALKQMGAARSGPINQEGPAFLSSTRTGGPKKALKRRLSDQAAGQGEQQQPPGSCVVDDDCCRSVPEMHTVTTVGCSQLVMGTSACCCPEKHPVLSQSILVKREAPDSCAAQQQQQQGGCCGSPCAADQQQPVSANPGSCPAAANPFMAAAGTVCLAEPESGNACCVQQPAAAAAAGAPLCATRQSGTLETAMSAELFSALAADACLVRNASVELATPPPPQQQQQVPAAGNNACGNPAQRQGHAFADNNNPTTATAIPGNPSQRGGAPDGFASAQGRACGSRNGFGAAPAPHTCKQPRVEASPGAAASGSSGQAASFPLGCRSSLGATHDPSRSLPPSPSDSDCCISPTECGDLAICVPPKWRAGVAAQQQQQALVVLQQQQQQQAPMQQVLQPQHQQAYMMQQQQVAHQQQQQASYVPYAGMRNLHPGEQQLMRQLGAWRQQQQPPERQQQQQQGRQQLQCVNPQQSLLQQQVAQQWVQQQQQPMQQQVLQQQQHSNMQLQQQLLQQARLQLHNSRCQAQQQEQQQQQQGLARHTGQVMMGVAGQVAGLQQHHVLLQQTLQQQQQEQHNLMRSNSTPSCLNQQAGNAQLAAMQQQQHGLLRTSSISSSLVQQERQQQQALLQQQQLPGQVPGLQHHHLAMLQQQQPSRMEEQQQQQHQGAGVGVWGAAPAGQAPQQQQLLQQQGGAGGWAPGAAAAAAGRLQVAHGGGAMGMSQIDSASFQPASMQQQHGYVLAASQGRSPMLPAQQQAAQQQQAVQPLHAQGYVVGVFPDAMGAVEEEEDALDLTWLTMDLGIPS